MGGSNEVRLLSEANANGLKLGLTPTEEQAAWVQLRNGHFFATNGAMCARRSTRPGATPTRPGRLTKTTTPKMSAWVDPAYVNSYLKSHNQAAGTC